MRVLYSIFMIVLSGALAGCVSNSKTAKPAGSTTSQIRPVDALPKEVAADRITVAQFRFVSDMMARDLVRQPFIVRAGSPPVVTIRKLQNKTGIYIDEQIFQETIRVKLMENSGGLILFRDDASYKDIIKERVRQSNEELVVTLTDTELGTKTRDRVSEREYEAGSLSGGSGSGELTDNFEEESTMDMSQTASVKSKVAAADYFLRGIIYQVNEKDMTKANSGMSYFQYQFRVVDARSGLIVWEKMVSSKMAGQYMLKPAQPASGSGSQTPQGWPTGTAVQPGAIPGQTQVPVTQQQTVQPVPGQIYPAQQQSNPVQQLQQIIPIIKKIQQ
ncbi:hypothetical protein [Desulfospira joergensenii]|uniref:hypothetical protein n=1 Tax=Desulfospira joergensenii TaxID=53329 RepID=UPI0003B6EF8E|nr:hypothetical protein [Desulfospira joergensenii]